MRLPWTPADVACQELVELVTPYLEDTMPRSQRRRIDHHIAGCDGCRSYIDQMRQTIRLSGRVEAEAVPPAVRAELLAAFRSATESS